MFSAIVKFLNNFWDRNVFLAKYPPVTGRTGDFITYDIQQVLCISCVLSVRELDYQHKKRCLLSILP